MMPFGQDYKVEDLSLDLKVENGLLVVELTVPSATGGHRLITSASVPLDDLIDISVVPHREEKQ